MKKKVFGRKLSRERDTRFALFRSLAVSLSEKGSVKTTLAKAKAVRPFIERIITLAKKGTTASKRRVFSLLANNKKATKNFLALAEGFKKRKGGYTRIVRLGERKGDKALMVNLQLVERDKDQEEEKIKKPEKDSPKKSREK